MSSFNPQDERQQSRDFVLHYLKDDGVFLTRLLSLNSSDLVITELINQLWLRYKAASRIYSTNQPGIHLETSTNSTENGRVSRPRVSRIPLPTLPDFLIRSQHEKSSKKDTDV